VNEVTNIHGLELELGSGGTGDCGASPFAPDASFEVDAEDFIIDEPICFTSTSIDDTRIISLEWDFGDGGRASGDVVCHTFRRPGTYLVTLTATDEDQNCGQATQVVTITAGEAPTCSISATPSGADIGDTITFVATATDPEGEPVTRFEWNFGDSDRTVRTSNPVISHEYDDSGTFVVTLTVTDSAGNESFCTTTVTIGSEAPSCSIETTPDPPTGGGGSLNVSFDASGSSDDGVIETFEWNFDDGSTANGETVSHTFTCAPADSPCVFNVSLTVTDDTDNSTTCSVSVTVTDVTDCNDGVDNDGDGEIDTGDSGCTSEDDNSELNPAIDCDDGDDNDGDGDSDSDDNGCTDNEDPSELDPTIECDDGTDNDADTFIDFPDDPQCTDTLDDTEA